MRTPEWRPSDAVQIATRGALSWWRERFPRRRRPAWQDEREEFLAYAFTMRHWTPEQIRYIADSVLKRTNNHWPDHAELEAEFEALKQRHTDRQAAHTPKAARWSGREDEVCPHCEKRPTYAIGQGVHFDHWVYLAPDCVCCGYQSMSSPSLWLRGVAARPEDDPYALAAMYREASDAVVTEWRRTGRSLHSLVQEIVEFTGVVA
jgi:hypothetical protein